MPVFVSGGDMFKYFQWIVVIYMKLYQDCNVAMADDPEEQSTEFWYKVAQDELKTALKMQNLNTNVAKNVILFIGDGMGISTLTSGRILKGQLNGKRGEETKLAMEKLPHVALSKIYTLNRQVSDSAATVTAMLSGVKANHRTLGVNGKVVLGDCRSQKGNEVKSVLEESYDAGKSTGIVTTTYLSHATPAGCFAHSADRAWITDAVLPANAAMQGCQDITRQFVAKSHKITVALGGGRKYFRDRRFVDEEYPTFSQHRGSRKDGKNLIEEWLTKKPQNEKRKYVWNQQKFDEINPDEVDRLLGLFEPGDMRYEPDRHKDEAGEPSLRQMTRKAIEVLQKNENGFFLMVEGGKIDHGHHSNNAYRALHELVAFDDAIEEAVAMTSLEDTLIIVSADHGHVFTIGGNSVRGNPIFGLAPSDLEPELLADAKPYTTLLYANGKGYQGLDSFRNLSKGNYKVERQNLMRIKTYDDNYRQQSAVPRNMETHSGEDVVILAGGPMAHLFHGIHEQNYIAHVIRYASCVGERTQQCASADEQFGSSATTKPNEHETTTDNNNTMSETTTQQQQSSSPKFRRPDTKASPMFLKQMENGEEDSLQSSGATSDIKIMYLGRMLSSSSAEHILRVQFVFLMLLSLSVVILLLFSCNGRRFVCNKNNKLTYPM